MTVRVMSGQLRVGLASLALALLATGCSGASQGDLPYEASAESVAASLPSGESDTVKLQEQVIRTANVSMTVDDVETTLESVTALVMEYNGFIQNQAISSYDGSSSATVTARIPAAELDAFLDALSAFGEVMNSSIDAQDVTLEVVDLQARITTLQGSMVRLRELQQRATSVADLVAVEAELANRQAELDSLEARRDYLANQVDLSSVYLSMVQERSGPRDTPDFLGGLQRGWDALLTLGAGLITGAGFILPTALVGIAIAVLVLTIIRLIRRRATRKDRP